MSIVTPLGIIHRILDEAHESTIKIKDLDELIHEPLDESFETKEHNKQISSKDILEIKNMSFTYPEKDIPALRNINLQIVT